MALHLKSTGIDFADISSGDLLDDYEEGTATMTARFGGTGGTSNGTGTLEYVKVGKIVSVDVYISLNNSIQGSGHAVITGLPITVVNSCSGRPYTNDRLANMDFVEARFSTDYIYWYMHPTNSSTNLANFNGSNWADGVGGKGMGTTGFYFV